jgi:hypothetical protein
VLSFVNFQFVFDFARQSSHTAKQMFEPDDLGPGRTILVNVLIRRVTRLTTLSILPPARAS